MTYNHEKYITQAIESVLAQEVNFPLEIIIGDDHSTDATRGIILAYERKYPQMIKVVLSPTNLGMNSNLIQTLKQSKGKYIALVEGDDFWTSPQKLDKQVGFLENNRDCTVCFHRTEVYLQNQNQIRGLWPDFLPPTISTLDDILQNNYIPTCSVMYRNIELEEFPEDFYDLGLGDWPLHVMYAKNGNIGFINETMARYRIHSEGMFSSLSILKKNEAVFKAREFMFRIIPNDHKKTLAAVIIRHSQQIARMSRDDKDIIKAKGYLAKGKSYFPYLELFDKKTPFLVLYIQIVFPRLYDFLLSVKGKFSSAD